MLVDIYKTKVKEGMYLYVKTNTRLEDLPADLHKIFRQAEFVMQLDLISKRLVAIENQSVMDSIKQQGFYLQLPANEQNKQ